MLSIILNYTNIHTKQELYNYITHINNINTLLQLELIVINCHKQNESNDLNNFDLISLKNNCNVFIYHYNGIFEDIIYNEIVKKCKYDIILFTNLNIYLTPNVFEFIYLNKINPDCFIRTSILELDSIPEEFYNNFNDSIYSKLSNKVCYINDENQRNHINTNTFIDKFNSDMSIISLTADKIIEHNLYYLNNTNDFLLVHKKTIETHGFNEHNKKAQLTFQYVILNLIKNNISLKKLPFLLSVYKKVLILENNDPINTLQEDIINIDEIFKMTTTFNMNINLKIYDVQKTMEKTYIRDHIKILNGINNNDLKNINKNLEFENVKLNAIIQKKNKNIEELTLQCDSLTKQKNILYEELKKLEIQHESQNKYITDLKNQYNIQLSIINTNINELLIKEKNNLEQF